MATGYGDSWREYVATKRAADPLACSTAPSSRGGGSLPDARASKGSGAEDYHGVAGGAMKPASHATLINEIVQRLVHDLRPLRIILYGSYAHGEPDEHSDIDMLVI